MSFEPGERYEEMTPTQAYTIYFYKDKSEDIFVVDVKKHNILKKLAMNNLENSSSNSVKEVQDEAELIRDICAITVDI